MIDFTDYLGYLEDNEDLLRKLEKEDSPIFSYLFNALDTCQALREMFHDLTDDDIEIDDSDYQIIFDAASGYVFETLEHYKAILKNNFNDNEKIALQFGRLIVYYFYLDELRTACIEAHKYENPLKDYLDKVLDDIDSILVQKLFVDDAFYKAIDDKLELIAPKDVQTYGEEIADCYAQLA